MKLKQDHLYKVLWIDAYSSNSWTDKNQIDRDIKDASEKPATCIGYYIKSTSKFYIFTTGFTDNEYFNYFAIPRSWIVNIKEIKE